MCRMLSLPFLFAVTLLLPAALRAQEGDKDPVISGKKASEWIEILKTSKESRQRRLALIVLRIGGPESRGVFGAMHNALKSDADKGVRITAATSLGKISVKARELRDKISVTSTIGALAKAVTEDKEPEVRIAAEVALSELADLVKADPEKHALLREDLKEVIPVLSKALNAKINDESPDARTAVADTLSRFGRDAKPAIDDLKEALSNMKGSPDNKPLIRARAMVIHTIGRLEPPESVSAVKVFVAVLKEKDVDPIVRAQIARTLGLMKEGASQASEALGELLVDTNLEVRRSAATALDEINAGARNALPAMIKAMLSEREDKYVRCHLINALGDLGKTLTRSEQRVTVLSALSRLTRDVTGDVRLAAIHSSGRFAGDVVNDLDGNLTRDPTLIVEDASSLLGVIVEIANLRSSLRLSRTDLKEEIGKAAESALKKIDEPATETIDE